MNRNILIIDDEPSILQSLSGVLGDEGYKVITAPNATDGIALLKKQQPDLVLLDIWMPNVDGLAALNEIKQQGIETPVVMMSGHGTVETAVKATKLGAYDFIEKPVELDRLLLLIRNALSTRDLIQENKILKGQLGGRRPLIAESAQMKQIAELIKRVAPTSGSVLITGENGTGKEVVAKTIHALSNRFKKPFIEVNCAAIPEELIESELFGHEKGAFTGAIQLRRGRFDLADEGTLFLDEIGDMSLKTQAKILRILQEQKFERVGGHDTHSVDVRVIAATNKDLKQEMGRGSFREDLYFRLNVVRIHIPPLRERKEDVDALATSFLREFSALHLKKHRELSKDARDLLAKHSWPGNVRELRNLIERLVILQGDDDSPISGGEIKPHLGDVAFAPGLSETLDNEGAKGAVALSTGKSLKDAKTVFEREYIVQALKENDWNVSKTAQVLGIERSYLHRRMKSFGIESEE
ncbi:MAG: sigma-54-dependent Fis family transcriptional regulator [Bdellovibrionales bacterium]|nr:sigma-54-dependent Fis family transcriptional regulator [Bdellovibrionales bacterium]